MPAGSPAAFRKLHSLSLGAIVALHAAGLWALSQQGQQTELPKPGAALFVSFVAPPAPEPVKPPEPLPRPKPVVKPQPKRIIAAVTPAPPPATVVEPPPPAEPVQAETAAAPTPPGPLEEVTPIEQPRFDMAYLNNPAPNYPAASKKFKERGQVTLRVLVSAGGEALRVEVDRSSGYVRLDDAAVRAVRKWRFTPARRGAENVEGWALVPILFDQKA